MDIYADVNFADDFLSKYSKGSHWEHLNFDEKYSFLFQATLAIDSLQSFGRGFSGKKVDENQGNEFPRDFSSNISELSKEMASIPENVKIATCLEAFSLSDSDFSDRRKWQKIGVKSVSIGKTSETYDNLCDKNGIYNHLSSIEAFNLMKQFLNTQGVYPIL